MENKSLYEEVIKMNELKVNYDNDRITLSARELHEFLLIETPFKKWFGRMAEYGFQENIDFREVMDKIVQNPQGGRPSTDYEISLDMAKEISMIQRNEKGKEARQYFIEVEKQWNSPERVIARGLIESQKLIASLNQQVIELKPKALFADAVSTSKTSILVGELAKVLKQNGVDTGAVRLFRWLRENGYLIKRTGTDYNMPTQRSMELGLFEIKETSITHSDGHVSISKTPKVTGKGQVYFVNKLIPATYELENF